MIKYPEHILKIIRQNLDLDENDNSKDKIIEEMDKDEAFSKVCEWEGIIGFSEKIRDWYKDIYNSEDEIKVLLEKPISNHPDDTHFKVVLARFKNKEYVTYEYNGKTDSYYWGHYYGSNQKGAIKDYLERGRYKDEEE